MSSCIDRWVRVIVPLGFWTCHLLGQQIYHTPYTFTTIAARSSGALIGTPSFCAVDATGNLYITDLGGAILKLTPAGVLTTIAGQSGVNGDTDGTGSEARFREPRGIALDRSGNLYVADSGNYTLRKITSDGVVTTLAGLAGSSGTADGSGREARFRSLFGIAVDDAGNIYVADSKDLVFHKIRKVTPAGYVTTWVDLTCYGLAMGGDGNLYATDRYSFAIYRITPLGIITTVAGKPGSWGSTDGLGSEARLGQLFVTGTDGPTGIAVDRAGNLYVADAGNATIRGISTIGEVTTLAGTPGWGGNADGTGKDVRFGAEMTLGGWVGGPFGVAVDDSYHIFVADLGNQSIRKGYPPPIIPSSGPGFGISGGQFRFDLAGPSDSTVVVESSFDLENWLPIWTNALVGGIGFAEPESLAHSNRFFRTRVP